MCCNYINCWSCCHVWERVKERTKEKSDFWFCLMVSHNNHTHALDILQLFFKFFQHHVTHIHIAPAVLTHSTAVWAADESEVRCLAQGRLSYNYWRGRESYTRSLSTSTPWKTRCSISMGPHPFQLVWVCEPVTSSLIPLTSLVRTARYLLWARLMGTEWIRSTVGLVFIWTREELNEWSREPT